MLPDGFGIDVVQEILARHQMIVLPQRLECPITALGCAQFAHQHALGRRLARQGDEDPQQIVPFPTDQVQIERAHRPKQRIGTILIGMLTPIQARGDFCVQIGIARGKLHAKHLQQRKIDMVGAMGIR